MSERHTRSKIPLKTYYSPADNKGSDYQEQVGDPGSFPFARGIRPDLYKHGWMQRELSGEGDPERSNAQLKYLIQKGQVGVDVIGDSPTMAMLDPDHPLAANAIGTQGVSLCCLQDYRILYKDLPLDTIAISASVPPIFALSGLYLIGKENNIEPGKLRGSVLQPPFYAEDCGYAMQMPIDLRVRLSLDSMEFAAKEMPRFHAFVEDTYFFSESGLNAVEEMALGFIEIRYLVREMIKRGVDVDSFAPRIAILVNCGMDFFEEVAKIRATRRLFAKMMKEEFGAKDPRSWAAVITCHTSGLSLTAQQPANNIIRGTIQALALIMAGVQAIEISAFDEGFRTPSPESHLIGLRTQQIMHLETNVAAVTDPLGGSYYMESLTDELEEKIWEMVKEIEAKGDPAELVEQGYFKAIFHNAMERYAKQIDTGTMKKVGVNVLQIPEEDDRLLKDIAGRKIEPYQKRIKEIKRYKEQRDADQIKQVLEAVYKVARLPEENLMPQVIKATEDGATMGEIAGAMRMAYDVPYDPFGFENAPI